MEFKPNEPVETSEPFVTVDGLKEGVHRFQLEVINEKRQQSAPAFFDVEVTRDGPPTR